LHTRQSILIFAIGVAGIAFGQPAPRTPEDAVRLGIERSRAVAAAKARVLEAEAAARALRSVINPRLEVAPGTGFTNSNAFLSQEFDLSGSRRAQRDRAGAEASKARAELGLVMLDTAAEVRRAYFRLARAQHAHKLAAELASFAARFHDLVKRKVDLGDASQVQAMRAELEAERTRLAVERATSERDAAIAEIASLLGLPSAPLEVQEMDVGLPAGPGDLLGLIAAAKGDRPESAIARAQVEASLAAVRIARARFGPTLFADLAADVWSLDRDPWRSDNVGFQIRLGLPLFDRGELRSGERAAQAAKAVAEAFAAENERRIEVQVRQAHAHFGSQLSTARGYAESIEPKARALLEAEMKGYEAGLVSFLEVIESQRAYATFRLEALEALAAARAAETAFLRAIGRIPGASIDAPSTEAKP